MKEIMSREKMQKVIATYLDNDVSFATSDTTELGELIDKVLNKGIILRGREHKRLKYYFIRYDSQVREVLFNENPDMDWLPDGSFERREQVLEIINMCESAYEAEA